MLCTHMVWRLATVYLPIYSNTLIESHWLLHYSDSSLSNYDEYWIGITKSSSQWKWIDNNEVVGSDSAWTNWKRYVRSHLLHR